MICVILGQLWYLIVSVPDLCRLSYFERLEDSQFKKLTTELIHIIYVNSAEPDQTTRRLIRFFIVYLQNILLKFERQTLIFGVVCLWSLSN